MVARGHRGGRAFTPYFSTNAESAEDGIHSHAPLTFAPRSIGWEAELEPSARIRSWTLGLAAGSTLGLAEWIACGVARTPPSLAVASLVGGALAGLLAGALAAASRRPALAGGLVLAGAMALEGISIASKDLAGGSSLTASGVTLALAAMGLWVFGRARGERPTLATLGAVAVLPVGAGWAAAASDEPWVRIVSTAVPLLWYGWLWVGARFPVLRWIAGLGLAVGLAGLQRDREPPPRAIPERAPGRSTDGPSVVLLVIDTLRADALDPQGSLASFARDGVEFRQCVSAAPWTLPAIGSLLTGLLPSQHGAVSAATPLAEDVTTLAEVLHDHGYATAAFTGGAFVGAAHHLDQGFDVFDSTCERRFRPFAGRVPLVWRLAKNRYLPLRWLVRLVDEFVGLAGVVEAAREWTAGAGPGPKFLFLHTYQVHDYYLYDAETDDEVLRTQPAPSARFAGRLSVHPSELASASVEDLAFFQARYRSRVQAVERLFPALVAALSPLVGEDALWVVTADHGEGFDVAAGRVHHGGRLHEDLLRVPLLVRAPGRLESGRRIEPTVRSIDVLPTLLDLVGLPLPEGLAGVSLLPALRGESPFPGSAVAEERAHGYGLLTLRTADWKWIIGPGHEELYRLDRDPGERMPLPGPAPEALQAEAEEIPRRFPSRTTPAVELDVLTLEQLRALGYL